MQILINLRYICGTAISLAGLVLFAVVTAWSCHDSSTACSSLFEQLVLTPRCGACLSVQSALSPKAPCGLLLSCAVLQATGDNVGPLIVEKSQ